MTSDIMQAARYYGAEDVRIEQVEIPALQAGEVRIQVAFAGICGSDLHEYYGGPHACTAHPHPVTGGSLPATLGHEFSGTVVEVAEGVDGSRLKAGARVCVEPVISCLECDFCKEGNRPLCEVALGFYGYNKPGGLATFTNVSQANVHVLPDNVSLDEAALAEPLAVAWHAVRQSGFKKGETALVIGAGPIGALVTRVLKAQGASWIAVSEPNPTRAAIATSCGADVVYDPLAANVDVPASIISETRHGVHAAFDCAGTQRTFDAAFTATRKRGRVVMVALWDKPAQIDLRELLHTEKVVTASCCFLSEDMREVLEAMGDGRIQVADLITARIPLKAVVKEGLVALKQEPKHIKVLVDLSK